jgi:choline kinase
MGGETPKTLLPVGERGPLLQYLLEGLSKAPIDDLLVVTGHRAEEVEAFVSETWEGDATFVRNSRYASWGNFHSVRVALDQSPGMDVMIVNCDVVVHPDVFRRVAESPGKLVLSVQRRQDLDQEDMRVQIERDKVLAIGKDLKKSSSHGEYTGVSLLRPAAHRLYSDICSKLEWQALTKLYYEDVYAMMLGRVDARSVPVAAGEYAEVDTPEDVAAAGDIIERHF